MGVKKFYRPILGYDGEMIDGGVPEATSETPGGVLKAAYVPELDEAAELADVITTVNDIIASLRASGAMEPIG